MHNRAVRAGHGESPTTRSLRAQECALLCCRWWCTSTPPPPPTLCVAPIFTYLASVFCTVRTPAHNATHHPINRHWLVNQISSSWRSEKGRNLLDLPFYYSWLCACCIISPVSSPLFAFLAILQSSCSLIRSQISTVRKTCQLWLVMPTRSVHSVHIVWSHQRISSTFHWVLIL